MYDLTDMQRMGIILFGMGCLCLLIVIMARLIKSRRVARCTERVTARIVNLVFHRQSDSLAQYPVYAYRYHGKEYEEEGSAGSNHIPFDVGDTVVIYLDPDKPTVFYDNLFIEVIRILQLAFGLVGGMFLIIGTCFLIA